MADSFTKAGLSRAAEGAARQNLNSALQSWRNAPKDRKQKTSMAVLANASALGQKLSALVESEEAAKIKSDVAIEDTPPES